MNSPYFHWVKVGKNPENPRFSWLLGHKCVSTFDLTFNIQVPRVHEETIRAISNNSNKRFQISRILAAM